jgi:hypothetical protein
MQGDQRVARRRAIDALILREWKQTDQGVDHHVSDQANPRSIDSLGVEVFIRVGRGREPEIRKLIGEDPVDLFRHGAVAGPETGLHVRYADPDLRTNQRCSHGRIHISIDDNPVRLTLTTHRFQASHNLGCLAGVASRTNLQVGVRLGHAKLLKKMSAMAES